MNSQQADMYVNTQVAAASDSNPIQVTLSRENQSFKVRDWLTKAGKQAARCWKAA